MTVRQGTIEYVDFPVTVVLPVGEDLPGDDATIEVSLRGRDWVAATWIGEWAAVTTAPSPSAGFIKRVRNARILLDTTETDDDDVPLWPKGGYAARLRLTDAPEIPIISAGTLQVI